MSPTPEARRHRRVVAIVTVVACALIVAGGVAIYAISSNQEKAASAQTLAKTVALENLRNCIRNNILSAVFAHAVQQPNPDDTPKKQAENKRLVRNLYPILSCRQSQEAGESIPLSAGEKAKYVDLVAEGRAPVVDRQGQVTGSGGSLLENIAALERGG